MKQKARRRTSLPEDRSSSPSEWRAQPRLFSPREKPAAALDSDGMRPGRRPLEVYLRRKRAAELASGTKPLMADMARGTTDTEIQRKIGFEVELSVPSFARAPESLSSKVAKGPTSKDPGARVCAFLFGGLKYGQNLGENEHFKLTPDHNELQGAGLGIVNKLLLKKRHNVKIDAYPTHTNLEYVSLNPIDELSAGSNTKLQAQFDAFQNHMESLTGANPKTKLSKIPAPAGSYYTGVPISDLKTWLGDSYSDIAGEVGNFQNAIHDDLYLQATAGIIPSAIRDLMKTRVPEDENAPMNVFQAAALAADKLTTRIVTDESLLKNDFIDNMVKNHPVSWQAWQGMVHVIAMYMVGSAINQTSALSTTPKNALPFLSKMNLGDIKDRATTWHLYWKSTPNSVVNGIAKFLKSNNLTKPEYWIKTFSLEDKRSDRKPLFGDPDAFIRGVLTGSDAGEKIRRGLTADTMSSTVKSASFSQKGVPFEYRYIEAKPKPSGLAAELMKIVDEVRELNTKHLDSKAKKNLLEEAKK